MEDHFANGIGNALLYLPLAIVYIIGPWGCIYLLCVLLDDIASSPRARRDNTSEEAEGPSRASEPSQMKRAPIKDAPTKLAHELTSEAANRQPVFSDRSTEVTALQTRIAHLEGLERQLIDARLNLRKLEQTLATTQDIPEGRLLLRGRLVLADKQLHVVTSNGKTQRMSLVDGFPLMGETGDQALVESVWGALGWQVWRVHVEMSNDAQKPLDAALVAKLTAKKEKTNPNFDDLDREAAENAVRTASHSKTAISLHIVLPTHARFSLTKAQAKDLKDIVVEVVEEIDLGKVAAIEVGSTENGTQRDHLHLLVSAFNHTAASIGHQVGRLKALSSGRLRRKHPDLREKLWSASYWVSSAGGSLDKVIAYIGDNAEKYGDP